MKHNPLTAIDFYKADHRRQYAEGTTLVYSNFTPRSDKLSNIPAHLFDGRVVFFGLQHFIKHFLLDTWNAEFFAKPKAEVVAKYKRRMETSLGTGAIPVEHIEALHDLGYLPICIKALPEGCQVPIKVPPMVSRKVRRRDTVASLNDRQGPARIRFRADRNGGITWSAGP